jgi:mannose-6-phosphate isomerase class I
LIHYYTDKTISAGVLIEQSVQMLTTAIGEFSQTQHLVIQFTHVQYYLPDQPQLELIALVSVGVENSVSVSIEGSIFLFTPERLEQLQLLPEYLSDSVGSSGDLLKEYCHSHFLPWLVISDPWLLAPIYIPKPWGQEIWYTGIESRGQAGVAGNNGNIPLPWLLELMPGRIGLAEGCQPILLKVLDPLPDEVYGDLYFELHQEKQEVYVVTHIDPEAWPEGIGAIQLGFAPHARKRYKTDNEFKQAYLDSVKAYEYVRRLVDARLDDKKAAAGIGTEQSATKLQLMNWISELSQYPENKELFDKELAFRRAMNSFVEKYPLVVGDVVTVPKLVPHALQHGVRVVEFQTPVYERKILSFGQKVLTQAHWDTEEALELVDLDFATFQLSELVSIAPQSRVERIVNFDDFEVQRIQLNGYYLLGGDVYSILMVLQGRLTLGAAERMNDLGTGQALLLPKAENGWLITSSALCTFLLASPRVAI